MSQLGEKKNIFQKNRFIDFQKPPFIYKDFDKDGKVIYTGYCVDLIRDLAKLLRFDYEIYEPPGVNPIINSQYVQITEKIDFSVISLTV